MTNGTLKLDKPTFLLFIALTNGTAEFLTWYLGYVIGYNQVVYTALIGFIGTIATTLVSYFLTEQGIPNSGPASNRRE